MIELEGTYREKTCCSFKAATKAKKYLLEFFSYKISFEERWVKKESQIRKSFLKSRVFECKSLSLA